MKKSFSNIEDLLLDESFRSWILHPTPELDQFWHKWKAESDANNRLVEEARATIEAMRFHKHDISDTSKNRIFDRLKAESLRNQKMSKIYWYAYRVAAILIITFGIWGYYSSQFVNNVKNVDENMRIKSTMPGEHARVMLPDGTTVTLNSSSTLTFPKVFAGNERFVSIQGEAFFDVLHDSDRPFKVKSEFGSITVLGTMFNVDAYKESFDVALVEGSVRVELNNGVVSTLLPGQMASYDPESGQLFSTNFDEKQTTGWKDGFLVFDESSYKEVVHILHQWYGVEISANIPPQFNDWSYTATFENESLENVLLSMRTLRHFEYSFENDSLIISFE